MSLAYTDTEFADIAKQLIEKHPHLFGEDIDLERVHFIRTPDVKSKWISRVRPCRHPWNTLPGAENIVYIIETSDEKWKLLNEAQRAIVVLHELKHIPDGGFTEEEKDTFAKVVDHVVQDFLECIAAAKGDPFWMEPGHGVNVMNLLREQARFNLDEALNAAVSTLVTKTDDEEVTVTKA
jgi:predicted metallopeptidase